MDELVEHWTLLKEDRPLAANKRGATRLGFVLLLKFYTQHGRFPRGRAELPDAAVEFVAGQVRVPASELGFYEWAGRTIKAHRVQIRTHLGFRECSVADAEKLTGWLAEHVALKERRPDQVHGELLARCRAELIEPPTAGRCARIVQGALHAAEEMLTLRLHARLPAGAVERILELEQRTALPEARPALIPKSSLGTTELRRSRRGGLEHRSRFVTWLLIGGGLHPPQV